MADIPRRLAALQSLYADNSTGLISAQDFRDGVQSWNPEAFGIYNVLAFGAVGDGVTDDTTAIQDAFDTAIAAAGTILIPAGSSFYKTTAAITITNKKSFVVLGTGVSSGDPRSQIQRTTAGDVFTLDNCDYSTWSNLYINGTGTGNGMNMTGGSCAFNDFDHVRFAGGNSTSGSAFIITSGGINNHWSQCWFESSSGHADPLFTVQVSGGNWNANVIEHCTFQSNANTGGVQLQLKSTAAANYLYQNTIRDNVHEIPNGGMIHLEGMNGTHVTNCWGYDMTGATTDDLIELKKGNGGTGLQCLNTVISQCGVVGTHTLGSGLKTLKLTDAGATTLINIMNHTGSGETVDLNSKTVKVINKGGGTWENTTGMTEL